MDNETILFRSSFPKQPITREKRIVMYIDDTKSIDDHGRFVVHNEYLNDNGNDFFRSEGFYANTYVEALCEYLDRFKEEMKWYQFGGSWDRIQSELFKQKNR